MKYIHKKISTLWFFPPLYPQALQSQIKHNFNNAPSQVSAGICRIRVCSRGEFLLTDTMKSKVSFVWGEKNHAEVLI